ncbi:COX15/CtaA family protein [Salinarchaeum laminariae]|uniref:COX15/CtaA family protein n=1 Tax=Salinarchaeum laminariae TaxID=869888 RepID=UPI0020BE953B|nr:COX15/CtaA family protein [Salinarchaeum laminariae]
MSMRSRASGFVPSLPRLAMGTLALTFVLMLLGIWTAVGGYGLTCEGRWPICDGAVFGLFPANFGSFVEWFHRLVAMVVGFAILGTTVSAWRAGSERRVVAAFALALVLTPLQIVLGALTVTTYERLILATHFASALAILALFAAGTVWTVGRVPSRDRLVGIAALVLAPATLLTPGVVIAHTAELHVLFNALALGGFLALFVASLAPQRSDGPTRLAAGGGAAAAAIAIVVGRVRLDPTGQATVAAGLAVAFALAVATLWLSRRTDAGGSVGLAGS